MSSRGARGGSAADIAKLRAELERHNHLYYVLDQPEISDSEYDTLLRKLQELESAHPELADPTSPTRRVGAPASERFGKVRRSVPMLSLDNAMNREEVEEFEARIRRFLDIRARSSTSPSTSSTASPSSSSTRTACSCRARRAATA